jgi:rhamnosyltransferase
MIPELSEHDASRQYVVIVPVLNGGEVWRRVALSIQNQRPSPWRVLVVDSGSDDGSDQVAVDSGFELVRIAKTDFDHGGTRQMAADYCKDMPFLVYLTQDAELAGPNEMARLLAAFTDATIGCAHGRQLPRVGAGAIESHARLFNYSDHSSVRSMQDIPRYGIKAAFSSNSFAAYRHEALIAAGGFPGRLIFAEDMVVTARMLKLGWTSAYVSDALVRHSHQYSVLQELRRYFDIGVLHHDQSWILSEFGKPEGEGGRFVKSELAYLLRHAPWLIPSSAMRTFFKYFGYKLGKNYARLPKSWPQKLSMHHRYWQRQSK